MLNYLIKNRIPHIIVVSNVRLGDFVWVSREIITTYNYRQQLPNELRKKLIKDEVELYTNVYTREMNREETAQLTLLKNKYKVAKRTIDGVIYVPIGIASIKKKINKRF